MRPSRLVPNIRGGHVSMRPARLFYRLGPVAPLLPRAQCGSSSAWAGLHDSPHTSAGAHASHVEQVSLPCSLTLCSQCAICLAESRITKIHQKLLFLTKIIAAALVFLATHNFAAFFIQYQLDALLLDFLALLLICGLIVSARSLEDLRLHCEEFI